jgi:transforming growth factor-beta-induced protein
VTAVVTAELLPALINPFAEFTVFAPTNDAFDAVASALGTDLAGILALPNLADILLYHVLGAEVVANDVENGLIATPLNPANTLKFTVTSEADVFVNQSAITLTDVFASNGVVHVIEEVVLPSKTVVDVAIENDFTVLTSAVIAAELLPALSNPFATFTVFAPTDEAFGDLASTLDVEVGDLLELDNLADILLYHVLGSIVLEDDLESGLVPTLSGANVEVTLGDEVTINTATVILTDVLADNGVVHVIDEVLMESSLSTSEISLETISVYPNPVADKVMVNLEGEVKYVVHNLMGATIASGELMNNTIQVEGLNPGVYLIKFYGEGSVYESKFIKM